MSRGSPLSVYGLRKKITTPRGAAKQNHLVRTHHALFARTPSQPAPPFSSTVPQGRNTLAHRGIFAANVSSAKRLPTGCAFRGQQSLRSFAALTKFLQTIWNHTLVQSFAANTMESYSYKKSGGGGGHEVQLQLFGPVACGQDRKPFRIRTYKSRGRGAGQGGGLPSARHPAFQTVSVGVSWQKV